MRPVFYSFSIAVIAGVLFTACNNAPGKKETARKQRPAVQDSASLAKLRLGYQPGDHIPHEFVCMMTDQYREMRQLLVLFEGKAYFGCCEKCQEGIPRDASMRTAVDPFSLKPVDKATAYIVLTGNNDKVIYFASEENYRQFLKQEKGSRQAPYNGPTL